MAVVIERDLGWKSIVTELKLIDNSFTKVGFPENAAPGQPNRKVKGKQISSNMSEIATIAAFNEFGTTGGMSTRSGGIVLNIPPRPFMSTSFDENVEDLNQIKGVFLGYVIDGTLSVRRALALIGEWMMTKTKKKILDIRFPANAPETIRRKKSDNPLIDTGQMINTVNHVEVIQ